MFIGREDEIRILRQQFEGERKSVILLYGRRRIGKTALVNKALKNLPDDIVIIYHEFHQITLEQNISELSHTVAIALNIPSLPAFNNIAGLFSFISALNKKIVVILDEYSDFKQSAPKGLIDSYMRSAIDNLPNNIKIVLMGSRLKIMEELLNQDNPLFGRFTTIIKLEPFDYINASKFFPSLTHYDQISFYSIFGGSPYVLSLLDEKKTLRQNIEETIIMISGSIRAYIEAVINQEAGRVPHGIAILSLIGNGKRKYQEIEDVIAREAKGVLAIELKKLMDLEIVEKIQPINKQGKVKCFYEISDPLLRFYFAYIYKNPSLQMSNPSIFYRNFIEHSIGEFISKRFETVCREFFMHQIKTGKRPDIINIGTYWYDDKEQKLNGEFDVALKTNDGYEIYDAKFYNHPFEEKKAEKEIMQIKSLTLNITKWGIIASSGFEKKNSNYVQLTLDDLYK